MLESFSLTLNNTTYLIQVYSIKGMLFYRVDSPRMFIWIDENGEWSGDGDKELTKAIGRAIEGRDG